VHWSHEPFWESRQHQNFLSLSQYLCYDRRGRNATISLLGLTDETVMEGTWWIAMAEQSILAFRFHRRSEA
jgi:hypothetical protein